MGSPPVASGASATLAEMRRALSGRPAAEGVALRDLVSAMEGETFPVLILLFALLLVSPLSAVPGATSLFGLTIAAIMTQWLLGRDRVWLPGVLLDRRLSVGRAGAALHRLHGPVTWVERRLRQRQRWVFATPFAEAPMLLVLMAALCAPLMEVIPASGTSVGAAMVLFSAGLLARDGVVVLAGAGLAGVLPVSLWLVLT
ncbi:exopolysaccharide biosynthesis protein [Rhodobaculum claviforme]|nr:exopolysaccharide biosynthesis protein [Rhodobaculum claviforme]